MMKKKDAKKLEWLNFDNAMLLLLMLAVFIILKTALTPKPNLEKEAEIVLYTLTDGQAEASLLKSNELIEEKIEKLDQMSYNKVKNMLGVKNDFCIFFEDTTGNIIKIDGIDPGVGSGKIYINGEPCK